MAGWIQAALDGQQTLTDIYGRDERDQPVLLGQGYETSRVCSAQIEGKTVTWTERIFVVHSQACAEALDQGSYAPGGRAASH
jgi:hypothetical protein